VAGSAPLAVALEQGSRWTFARALDWPGWCRRGKGDEAALEALASYRKRYAAAVGRRVPNSSFEVVARLPGSATTDFGAPGASGPIDDDPLTALEARRFQSIMRAAWDCFDRVADDAPDVLTKGPRGGGRDREAIVEHVREAERAYARQWQVTVPPRTPWPEQRDEVLEVLTRRPARTKWSLRYGVHRVVWHVLDHAWEMEDRTPQ
jgi:hypothetical protein